MGVKVRWHRDQYYLFVNHDKRRKAYKAGTDEKRAKKLAAEMMKALDRGTIGLPDPKTPSPLLKDWLKTWLSPEGRAGRRCKIGTLEAYQGIIDRYILDEMGDTRVCNITPEMCIALIVRWKKEGLRTNTLQLIGSTLSSALTGAPGLVKNPAFKLQPDCRVADEEEHTVNPWTRAETDTFLRAVAKRDPGFYHICLIGLRTGMRIGEILALQWRDVDFDTQLITVQRSRSQKGVVGTPKRGRRYIDLSEEIASVLSPLMPTKRDTEVVVDPDEKPYEQRHVGLLFHAAIDTAKTRHIRVHDMRHTFASQLLQAGAPVHYVSKQLGHKNILITVKIYGHLIPGENRGWVNGLTPAAKRNSDATKAVA